MNIIGENKNIVNIKVGHEAEGYALLKLSEIDYNNNDISKVFNVIGDAFIDGIKFIAPYLKEYGIAIEINDKEVETTRKEEWYSGEIVKRN